MQYRAHEIIIDSLNRAVISIGLTQFHVTRSFPNTPSGRKNCALAAIRWVDSVHENAEARKILGA